MPSLSVLLDSAAHPPWQPLAPFSGARRPHTGGPTTQPPPHRPVRLLQSLSLVRVGSWDNDRGSHFVPPQPALCGDLFWSEAGPGWVRGLAVPPAWGRRCSEAQRLPSLGGPHCGGWAGVWGAGRLGAPPRRRPAPPVPPRSTEGILGLSKDGGGHGGQLWPSRLHCPLSRACCCEWRCSC